MHKALLLKYPDSGIPSFFTFVKEYSIYLACANTVKLMEDMRPVAESTNY